MQRAINTLKVRIEKIEQKMVETQKIVDEPEMLSDYEFAINDLGNYELEISELHEAIKILLTHSDESCLIECTSCDKEFEIESMTTDSDDNWFCQECFDELAPVMQAEYDELVAKGEIEPE